MTHLIIVQGHERGKEVAVPKSGLRVGRARANDISVQDEALSQFHCRFFFKSDGGLWVTDFASTNQTLVNEVPITEARLHVGDTIEVGNEQFRVVRDRLEGLVPIDDLANEPEGPDGAPSGDDASPPDTAVQKASGHDVAASGGHASFDLGFGLRRGEDGERLPVRRQRLLWTALSVLLILAAVVLAWWVVAQDASAPEPRDRREIPPLTVLYEKVEGGPENIFRYALRIEDGELHIQIDDLKNQRHVSRETALEPAVLAGLTETLMAAEFSELQPDYTGVSPGVHNLADLTLVFGRRAHRVRVLNRVEPDRFKQVREAIEEFGRTELGLAALAMTPDRLLEMARESYLEGRKRYEEREVRYGNLAQSIQQFTLAIWYLDTIEPKPDFYVEALQSLEQSRRILEERYNDLLFRAERAMMLRDWEEAARNLRVIIELIPDRRDERHQNAETRLLTVERYLR